VKNYDLIWAREWTGLTQAQAADKMGVHPDTFGRWETGARAMPARKWQLFVKLIGLPRGSIPKRLEYDAKGYPVGFDQTPYDEDHTATGDWDLEGETAALLKIEGDDYAARARERYRLQLMRLIGDPGERYRLRAVRWVDEEGRQRWKLGSIKDEGDVAREMAEYDAEARRLAARKNSQPAN